MSKTICFLLKAKQPTDAQFQAGNYLKKKLAYRGLTITIENHAGSSRSGKDRDGHEWTTHMKNDYGYINRTEGVDGDHVDCYIGPDDSADSVYIVHQRKAGDWKSYDEDKVMLGFESEQEATQAYLKHYDDPRFLGPVTSMPFDEFKEKVLATMEKPAMIKSLLVLEKSLVQPHLRRMKTGRVVSVGGYENNRSKQVELTPEEKARQGDLLAAGDTVTESRQELIDEHEHLVDVLNSPSHEDDKAEAKKQAVELAEYKGEAESWNPESAKANMTREQFVDAAVAQIKAKREAKGESAFTGFMGDTENDFRRDAGIAWDEANEKRKSDSEAAIRALWDEQGVPKERQDELIAQIRAKAAPGASVGPFKIQPLRRDEVTAEKIKALIGNGLDLKEFPVEGGGKVRAQVKITTRGGVIKTKYLHITAIEPSGKYEYYREMPNGNFKMVTSGRLNQESMAKSIVRPLLVVKKGAVVT